MITWVRMNLPSKSIKHPAPRGGYPGEYGSAMTVVVFFAAIAMITVFSYLFHQISYAKISLGSPSSLQALFNARSGIYRAFYQLIDSTIVDTLPAISTLDSTFGASMFGGTPDTTTVNDTDKLQFDGSPILYDDLFDGDSLGECEVSMKAEGGRCILHSIGRYRMATRAVTVALGCRTPALPDTVIVYRNEYPWNGTKPRGTIVSTDDTAQTNTAWLNQLVDGYLTDITETDSFLMNPPLIIQSNHDLQKIDSVVNGPLLIDGGSIEISWRDTGTIIVKGDLQVTGEVNVEGINFIVAGEIKLLDKASFVKSNIFSQSRLFIGDEARFEGNALALHSITVYGKAQITGKSSLITGATSSSATSAVKTSDSLKYSILLSEESEIDAICIAIGAPGSIKTDQETKIIGILWAQHTVCHRGRMAGLICAGRVVDCDDPLMDATSFDSSSTALNKGATGKSSPLAATQLFNSMSGDLEPLPEIAQYNLPFFLGRLSIVSWKE